MYFDHDRILLYQPPLSLILLHAHAHQASWAGLGSNVTAGHKHFVDYIFRTWTHAWKKCVISLDQVNLWIIL